MSVNILRIVLLPVCQIRSTVEEVGQEKWKTGIDLSISPSKVQTCGHGTVSGNNIWHDQWLSRLVDTPW